MDNNEQLNNTEQEEKLLSEEHKENKDGSLFDEYKPGEIDRSGIEFNSDADTTINSAALANQDISSDEMSLMDTIGQNSFILFFKRAFIKTKNHITIIPLILTVISMMVLTIPIQAHVNTMSILKNDKYNAFYLFVNIILSIISILCYININSKKTSKKKKIVFSVLFYILMISQALIDFYFLRDIRIETNLYNLTNKVVDTKEGFLHKSQSLFLIHMIFVLITVLFAILAPILQPVIKKISLTDVKKKNDTNNTDGNNDHLELKDDDSSNEIVTLETSHEEIKVEDIKSSDEQLN